MNEKCGWLNNISYRKKTLLYIGALRQAAGALFYYAEKMNYEGMACKFLQI